MIGAFVLALAASASSVVVPSTFEAGRVFAFPIAVANHRRLKLWVDTDGSGFITQDVVKEFKLRTSQIAWRGHSLTLAPVPRLQANAAIPPPIGWDGRLPVFDPPSNDAIFAGLDGQLGASWLQDRIWLLDYPGERLELLTQEPAHPARAEVRLQFDHDAAGKRLESRQFPSLHVRVDGQDLLMALDTAATVVLNDRTVAQLADRQPAVRAASFITDGVLNQWHARHPQWRFIADAGKVRGVALIQVPDVAANHVHFKGVWFSTRPDDDVFEGERVVGKLGPTAFGYRRIVIDYPNERVVFF